MNPFVYEHKNPTAHKSSTPERFATFVLQIIHCYVSQRESERLGINWSAAAALWPLKLLKTVVWLSVGWGVHPQETFPGTRQGPPSEDRARPGLAGGGQGSDWEQARREDAGGNFLVGKKHEVAHLVSYLFEKIRTSSPSFHISSPSTSNILLRAEFSILR